MSRRIGWALRLHWLGMLLLGLLALMLLTFSLALAQETKETETQKPWTGKLKDGREITQADLDQILQAHALWLRSNGKEGQKAELGAADLSYANLSGTYLFEANLSMSSLGGANLKAANLWYTNLSRARLVKADLSGAQLYETDLSGADLSAVNLNRANLESANLKGANLIGADLSMASLVHTNLSLAQLSGAKLRWTTLNRVNLNGASLFGVDLSGAWFDPQPGFTTQISSISSWSSIKGLDSIRYEESPYGLMELRDAFKKGGMRKEEREVIYALNHTRREKLWEQGGLLGKLESLFQLVCFEWTCQYGMNPGRPLKILGLGLFLFTLPYLLALRSRNRETGIWLVLPPDRIIGGGSKVRPFKLTRHTPFRPLPPGRWPRLKARLSRGLRRVRLAFYFSLLSAFNLGWRELNVGNWISRLQKHEYTLRATGWPRTVGGLQSLLSVYLLALWVLTYFGRPFD